MQKKILMIGQTVDLPGVPVDIADFYDFFVSPAGGHWNDDEIEILENPSHRKLIRKIVEMEDAEYDYLITIFSGHGVVLNDKTVLFINGDNDSIVLDDLMGLSHKQLIIADCCRSNFMLLPVDLPFPILWGEHYQSFQ